MSVPTRTEILRLYKNLLRYGQELKYTDQKYYYRRVRNEFLNTKQAKDDEIEYLYKFIKQTCYSVRLKWTADKSRVPVLNEDDLKETFVKGGGPGGSNVNKRVNCVCLIHKQTGIVVKCHEDRSLQRNRMLARERMITKLDNFYNGEDSVENQEKRREQEKQKELQRRRRKLLALREQYKKSANQDENCEP